MKIKDGKQFRYKKQAAVLVAISFSLLCVFYPIAYRIGFDLKQSKVNTFMRYDSHRHGSPIDLTPTNLNNTERTAKDLGFLPYWNPKEWSELYKKYKTNETQFFAKVLASNIKFKNNNKQLICKDKGRSLKLLVGVKSTPKNYMSRRNIRKTWGLKALQMGVKLVFIIGNSNPNITRLINAEKKKYMDLIEGDFTDNYYNLTLKSMLFYKWTITYCPLVKYVVKMDDDVIINVPKLIQYLPLVKPRNVAGYLWTNAGVMRDNKHKWYIPKYLYPWTNYPDFLSGTFLILSNDAVWAIYLASNYVPYFNLDDVYETGMLRLVGRVELMDFRDIIDLSLGDHMCNRLAFIQINRKNYLETWKSLKDGSWFCERFW